jgi:N-acetylmuramoyl-L-alanine amidase
MPDTLPPPRLASRLWLFTLLVSVLVFPFLLTSAEDKHLAVYTRDGSFFLPIVETAGRDYVVLEELVQHLGPVNTSVTKKTARVRVGRFTGEFTNGSSKTRIGNVIITSTDPMLLVEGRVHVPLSAVPLLLKNFGLGTGELHPAGRRLFLEGAKQHVEHALKAGDPSSLVLQFPAPVNPNISTDGGRVRLLFRSEPIVWGADRLDYSDKLFRSLSFAEQNGMAEITVQGSAPLLASFSNGGKTLTISAAPPPAVVAQETPPSTAPSAAPEVTVTTPTVSTDPNPMISSAPPQASAGIHYAVVIDAAHGGDEPGVRFSEKSLEKDVTLALAHRLRSELVERGLTVYMLRSDDSTINNDERAVIANDKQASIFVSLHAGGPGTGVRVYTALTPQDDRGARRDNDLFVPWQGIQNTYLDRSRMVATTLVAEFANQRIEAAMMPAAVSPLKSIAAPAIAIEVAPPPTRKDADGISLPAYQRSVVEAVAKAIVIARGKIAHAEARR